MNYLDSLSPDAPRKVTSLSDLAYEKLLEALFNRRVPAGAFMSQRDLVELLGVPVQPLRDALKVLEAEGVVTIHPRSGIQFVQPDHQLVHNTYQFRSIIERAAARRFAEVGDEALITEMIDEHRKLLADIEGKPFGAEALEEMSRLEKRLHDGMIESLNNPLIDTAARRLKNYVILMRLDVVMTRPFATRTIHEHLEILEACAARDGARAEEAVASHFQGSIARMMGSF
jgi:DNA-binding GntR family transcriptional regulator